MIKKILFALGLLIAAVLLYATTKPDEFRVERSIAIKAPPEKIFRLVNDLRSWESWSPWEKVDPAMKRSFSGPVSGEGARYAWDGNGDVGAGSMEIVESRPAEKIRIALHFTEPFEGRNTAEFAFVPAGDATQVTWSMAGPMPYLSKLMDIALNMDRMIGGEFEKGLANLKAATEK